MVINDSPNMTSVVYRGLEATNQTDTNFDAYHNVYQGNISAADFNVKKGNFSQGLVLNLLKVKFLIFCRRIIVVDNY